jgi:hypothetical protein
MLSRNTNTLLFLTVYEQIVFALLLFDVRH